MTRILSLFVMFMLFGVVAFSQNRVVTGTVTDEKGTPVEGASVRVVGTNAGAATDQNGNFRLANVAPNASLQISSVGVASTTVSTGTGSVVNVSVSRNGATGTELQAVTVGALGVRTSRRSQGYTSAAVSAAQLTQGRPVNVAQGLSGKVSGLTITNTSNSVNAAPRIVLRGLRSISGNNQALIVIDGVQVPSSTINNLNANDIERVDVLKGGQAATLFGSDGINGAIVITTKKGANRKPEITLMNTMNIESVAYMPRTQHGFGSGSAYGSNTDENFHPAENQQYGPAYDGSIRPLGRTMQNGSILLYPYSDIRNVRRDMFETGYTRQTDLSYRAGDATSSLFLGVQNLNSNGIVPGDKYERNTIRFNTGKTYNKVGLSFDGYYTFDNAKRANSDYYFTALNSASWVPMSEFKDWKNDYKSMPSNYFNDYYNNPYWEKDNNRFNTRSYTFNGNIKLDYKANANLTFTGRTALTQINSTQTTTSNNYTYSAYSKSNAFVSYLNNDYDRFLTNPGKFIARSTPIPGGNGELQNTSSRITFDAFADYNKKFNDFSLRTIIGTQASIVRSKALAVSTNAIGIPDLYNAANSASGLFNGSNSELQQRKIGAFADATIGFRDMLFLQGTYRRDYTSVFYDTDPSLNYSDPSFETYGGAVSFVVSDLIPSIKNHSNKILDLVKLKASYNVNGNDNLGAYQLRQVYPFSQGYPYSGLLGTTVGNTVPDKNLQPEQTKSSELGMEVGFFGNRLLFEGSVYKQICDKQVFTVSIDPASGFQSYLLNAGKLENKGYEMDLKAVAYRSKNLSVNLNANYSYNTNKITALYNAAGLTNFEYQAPDDRASLNATVGQTFPYLKTTAFLRDAQGKIVIDPSDGWPERTNGRVNQGSTLPKHNLGLGFNVKFKNITLAASAEFRGGAIVYHDLGTDMAFTGSGAITTLYNRQQFIWPNSVYLDGSGKSIPNTNIAVDQYKAIYQGFGDQGFSRGLAGIGEMFISSADFWKIRDASLTYDFPDAILGNHKIIKGASFSVWGRNLITILAKDNWYTDPEFSNTNGNSTGINTSLNTPPTRQLGGTLKLVF